MRKPRASTCGAALAAFVVMSTLLQAATLTIVLPPDASSQEKLAAGEIRRYLYLRTGELVSISDKPGESDCIIVGRKDREIIRRESVSVLDSTPDQRVTSLKPQEYFLKSSGHSLIIAGGDDIGTLYGAYRFAEALGVRFYMEGDVIPDVRVPLALPKLDEKGSPIFELRGIQPFHDFPEGPDWWNTDMYQAIISQLPKMRMNFFGLHTYPEGNVGPEPVVWIGTPNEVGEDGRVKASYPSRHFSTASGTWGSTPKKTSEYLFGASLLFEEDAYSQDVQVGMNPWPSTPEACNEFFNRFGEKLRTAFTHARSLGVKTCIGTETPLIPPTPVRQRLQPQDSGIQVVGGAVADYGAPIEGTDEDVLYQSVRFNLQAYRLHVPNGSYKVTLKFSEIAYDAPGKRVFGVKLQGKPAIQDLDIFARVGKNKALDLEFADVQVTTGILNINFVPKVEYPCIAAIVVQGPKTVKINCGSAVAYKDFMTDEGRQPLQPEDVEQLYTGMFLRIMRTHPLDYYWFWTPEGWTWSGVSEQEIRRTMDDLKTAIGAAKKVNAPFELATCGWVLGPQTNRALFDNELPKNMPVSCINRAVGHDPVEPAFANVQGRGKWAIPWLEDDPGMISPQLWAGRMRKDAADAKVYGCTGLMGIHWRTRILGPNVSALAQAAWDQSSWPQAPVFTEGADGGKVETFADQIISGTNEAPIYQSQRSGLKSYCIPTPNGTHSVALKFCELVHNEKGKRVFTVKLQGKPVLENFDIFAEAGRGKALDKTFGGIAVTDGWLVIEFVPQAGEPCIAGVQDNGPYGAHLYNCGGPAWGNYAADPQPKPANGRYLPVVDFYRDWARQSFGANVAEKAGDLFARIDGNLPRPSNWINGPGGVFPDARAWEQVRKDYAFVDEMESLRSSVQGAGNLERFDYWLNTFRYLRANGKVDCVFARQNAALEELRKQPDDKAKQKYAREKVLPIRVEMIKAVEEVYKHLLACVTNISEMGTIANWEQHSLPGVLTGPGDELAKTLGQPLPPEAVPSQTYAGTPRLIVPVNRTAAKRGEALTLKMIVLGKDSAQPVLHWRPLGKDDFQEVTASNLSRGVYKASFPAGGLTEDVEYYIEVPSCQLRFPAAAPEIAQTVIATD